MVVQLNQAMTRAQFTYITYTELSFTRFYCPKCNRAIDINMGYGDTSESYIQ